MHSSKKASKEKKHRDKKKNDQSNSRTLVPSSNLFTSPAEHSQTGTLAPSLNLLHSPDDQSNSRTLAPSSNLFTSPAEHSQTGTLTPSLNLLHSPDDQSETGTLNMSSSNLLDSPGTLLQSNTSIQDNSPSQQLPTDQIAGYVHQVSDIRTPKSGNVYFDFNLQMSPTKVARGICYSPEKRLKLKEIEEKKIPVIIDNVQRSVARRRATEQEYTVKKKSKITPSVVDYSFNEAFSQTAFTLDQVAEISDYQTIKVDAKVISEGDESSLQVRGKTLSKVDYIIADKFASIKLVVWEKTIHVDVNKSYSFTNISVRTFNDVKYLTTTKYTAVKQIDNLTETADATSAVQNYGKTVQGRVVALTVANFKTCIFCNMKIQIADDEATTVKCSNCKMAVLVSQLGHSTLSKIVIKEDTHDSLVTYTLLDSVLNTFLVSLKLPNVNTFTEVELLNLFASYQTVYFTVSEKEKLISNISVNV